MTPMSRLETFSPKLARELRHANPIRRRRAAFEACLAATSAENMESSELAEARKFLRKGDGEQAQLEQQLRMLASKLDEEYLTLNSAGKEVEAMRFFSSARIATAWMFALSGEPDEAVYEALIAVGDPKAVIRAVDAVLTS